MAVKTTNAGRSTTQRAENEIVAPQIYRDSRISGSVVTWAGAGNPIGQASFSGAQIAAGVTIQLLIFSSDYPVFTSGISFYGPSSGGMVLTTSTWDETVVQEGDPATLTGVVTAALTTYDPKQRIFGSTPTNALEVGGFGLLLNLANRGLVDAGNNPLGNFGCAIGCFAENGVLSGQPNNFAGGAGAPPSPAPLISVILREADYTSAIQAAGNIFTDSNGVVCKVMGLAYNANL